MNKPEQNPEFVPIRIIKGKINGVSFSRIQAVGDDQDFWDSLCYPEKEKDERQQNRKGEL